MLLKLEHICKVYKSDRVSVPALTDVSLSVDTGEYVAIMGPSGSGKSTLMNIIGCLDRPTSGTYELEGRSLLGRNDRDMAKVRLNNLGFVFQNFQLMNRQTALDNVMLPLVYAGVRKKERIERAKASLARVGLSDRLDFKPSQLSGGQKQRVAIARALASDPEVILCDEATSALDPKTTRSILALLKKINEERGITLVVITHEMEVIKQLCNKVAVIENGEIVERGEVQEIFRKPKTKAARKLFFPDEEYREKPLTKTSTRNRVRLVFDEATAGEPIIGNMIMELGAPVNFLYANLDVLGGAQKGQMVICLAEDKETADKQKAYLMAKGVEFTEIDEDEINGEVKA